jgi:hypothetical protein
MLHIGTFGRSAPGQIPHFASAITRLDYLQDLGINAVEILPDEGVHCPRPRCPGTFFFSRLIEFRRTTKRRNRRLDWAFHLDETKRRLEQYRSRKESAGEPAGPIFG